MTQSELSQKISARDEAHRLLARLTTGAVVGALAGVGALGYVSAQTIPGKTSTSTVASTATAGSSTSTSSSDSSSSTSSSTSSSDDSSSGLGISSGSVSAGSSTPVAVTGGSH